MTNLQQNPSSSAIARLIEVMRRLRDPQTGCAWKLEQNFKTITPYTIEEAYEVVEAIEGGNLHAIKDELGDLLYQIVLYAQIASEKGDFTFDDIAGHVADKMIERHPHVFGDRVAKTSEEVLRYWEADKQAKRIAKNNKETSVFDGLSHAMPAWVVARKLQDRAARVGWDWDNVLQVFDKMQEELAELRHEVEAVKGSNNQEKIMDELGDVIFVTTNLARKLNMDFESALRQANKKFERRFRAVENYLIQHGIDIRDATPEQREDGWQAVKAEEKRQKAG